MKDKGVSGRGGVFFGGVSVQGDDCELSLAAKIFSLKLAELGVVLSEDGVVGFFKDRRADDVLRGVASKVRVVGGRADSGIELSASLKEAWRIEMFYAKEKGVATVTVLACSLEYGNEPAWSRHDLPSGSPSFTQIEKCEDPFGGGGHFCHVARETHFSNGELWDRSLHAPADSGYYPDGTRKWEIRYTAGRRSGRGGEPWCKFFWDNGAVMAEEYGGDLKGRHRSPEAGHAYAEYYPSGDCAGRVFAVDGVRVGQAERFFPDGGKIDESQWGLEGWWATSADSGGGLTLGGEPSLTVDSISSRLRG